MSTLLRGVWHVGSQTPVGAEPHRGWQLLLLECCRWHRQLSSKRQELLQTRGLLAVTLAVPPTPEGGTFQWILQRLEPLPCDAVWFVDSSLFDEARRILRGTAFAVVVVSTLGDLLAYGNGVPPQWVHDAAGGEMWAVYTVAQLNPTMPAVVTDCLGIVRKLMDGLAADTTAKKRLARIWNMLSHILDGDAEPVLELVRWMPAHQAAHAIGRVLDSRGQPLTTIMWRATRLVDALAKLSQGQAGQATSHAHSERGRQCAAQVCGCTAQATSRQPCRRVAGRPVGGHSRAGSLIRPSGRAQD